MSGAEVLAIIGILGPMLNVSAKLVANLRKRRREKGGEQAILEKELEKALGEGELDMRQTYHTYAAQIGESFTQGDEISQYRVTRHILQAESMKRVLELAWEHETDISDLSHQMAIARIIPHEVKQTMDELSLRIMSRRSSVSKRTNDPTISASPRYSISQNTTSKTTHESSSLPFPQDMVTLNVPNEANSSPPTRSTALVASPTEQSPRMGLNSPFDEDHWRSSLNQFSQTLTASNRSSEDLSSLAQPVNLKASTKLVHGQPPNYSTFFCKRCKKSFPENHRAHHEEFHSTQVERNQRFGLRERERSRPSISDKLRGRTIAGEIVKTRDDTLPPFMDSTRRTSSFDTTGSGSSGNSSTTTRLLSEDPIEKKEPRSRLKGRAGKDNGFHGFCQGAWIIQADMKKGMPVTLVPIGMVGTLRMLKCCKCHFRGHAYPRDKKHLLPDSTVRTSNCGIRFRFSFLAKSHKVCKELYGLGDEHKATLNQKMLEQRFGCIFCCADGYETDSFGGSESLMNHILVEHARDIRDDLQKNLICITGRRASSNEDFDINIPPELLREPGIRSPETVSEHSSLTFVETENSAINLSHDEQCVARPSLDYLNEGFVDNISNVRKVFVDKDNTVFSKESKSPASRSGPEDSVRVLQSSIQGSAMSLNSETPYKESRLVQNLKQAQSNTLATWILLLSHNKQLARLIYEETQPEIGQTLLLNICHLLKPYHEMLLKAAQNSFQIAIANLIKDWEMRLQMIKSVIRLVQSGIGRETSGLDNGGLKHRQRMQNIEAWSLDSQVFTPEEMPWNATDIQQLLSAFNVTDRSTHKLSPEPDEGTLDEFNDLKCSWQSPLFVIKLQEFAVDSAAFRTFLHNLRILFLPAKERQLCDTISKLKPNQVLFSNENNTSLINRWKGYVEDKTHQTWDWWPMKPYVQTIRSDQTRVHWRCLCDRELTQIVDSKHSDLLKAVLHLGKLNTDLIPVQGHLCEVSGSLGGNAKDTLSSDQIGSNLQQVSSASSKSSSSATLEPSTSVTSSTTGSENTGYTSIDMNDGSLEVPTIFFGIQGYRDTLEVVQIDVDHHKTDIDFFRQLKIGHRKVRPLWKRLLSIWTFNHCDFVKFEKFGADAIISRGQGLPLEGEYKSQYDYFPKHPHVDALPVPISPHEFYARLSHCSRPCSFAVTPFHSCPPLVVGSRGIQRTPKRKFPLDIMADSHEFFWGLEASYMPRYWRLFVYQLLSIIGPLAFLVYWQLRHPNHLQTAVIPISLVISLLQLPGTIVVLKMFEKHEGKEKGD